ncbi:MAG: sigma factor-like helix-turn-helix DNA-binding protein [Patescibacteria group bacterium]
MVSKDIQKTVALLLKDVVTRNRDIITRRFGLKNGKKETLESIGRGYGITRERVRQIEEFTLKQLLKLSDGNPNVASYVNWARELLESRGGVLPEKDLFKAFSGQESDSPINASLFFILSTGDNLIRSPENEEFQSFWASNSQNSDLFKNSAAMFVKTLERNNSVVPLSEIADFAKRNSLDNIESCLSISKLVNKNIFGQVGLVSWSEVKPRGVKDKAYLVLKRNNSPKHFVEIARLINEANFSNKKANIQTVHNELIKDSRFVLVGRGMYALSEWGYSAGTVKDILVDILRKSQKPMLKASLIAKVKDARIVKENTIVLNLQDSKTFSKKEDGTYSLRKA